MFFGRSGSFASLLLGCWLLAASTYPGEGYSFPEMRFFPPMPDNPENPVSVQGVALGRYLFYDPILSRDSNMACATCHQQTYAFSGGPARFSAGRNGKPLARNTLPLFNLAWYPAFFWDGRAVTLENQVFEPVAHPQEMSLPWAEAASRLADHSFYASQFQDAFGNVPIDSILVAKALGQFLRTLISYQSKYDQVLAGKDYFTHQEFRGFQVANEMDKGDCIQCHSTDSDALGTHRNYSNNGLNAASQPGDYPDAGRGAVTGNPADFGKFKTPSLRNLVFTAPYMHDGRFETLQEVLDFYSTGVQEGLNTDSRMSLAHQGGVQLNDQDKADLIAFLLTLSDSAFVREQAFSNPFLD